MHTAGSWYLSNCGNYFWGVKENSRCVEPVAVYIDTMRPCSALTWRKTRKTTCKEPDNSQQRLFLKRWVALWVGAEHSEPISGDQVVHTTTVHCRRWVSVKTIRLNSLTFFNLHQAETVDSPKQRLYLWWQKIMNSQFPADSLWVSLPPPTRLHLGDCNTQKTET